MTDLLERFLAEEKAGQTWPVVMPVCGFCGGSLVGRRSDARYCSAPCRAEAWRLRRLLSGQPAGPYLSLADRLAVYGNRRRSRSQASGEVVE
jgi:hypothetical protein